VDLLFPLLLKKAAADAIWIAKEITDAHRQIDEEEMKRSKIKAPHFALFSNQKQTGFPKHEMFTS
jgi:inactivated superfamily I helicase